MHRCGGTVTAMLQRKAAGTMSSNEVRRSFISTTPVTLSSTPSPSSSGWKGPDNSGSTATTTADSSTSPSDSKQPAAAHKLSSDKNVASDLVRGGSATSAFLDHLPQRLAYLAFIQGRKFIVPAITLPASLAMCTSYFDFGASMAAMCVAQRIITKTLGSKSFAAARAAAAPVAEKFVELTSKPVTPGGEDARAAALKELRDALPLSGQVAVVTGATGPIGGMVANELRALGAQVYISHRAHSSTDKQVLMFHPNSRQPNGGEEDQTEHILHPLTSIPLDLADRSSVRSFVQILNDLITKRSNTNKDLAASGTSTPPAANNSSSSLPCLDILVHAASTSQYVFGVTKAHKTDPHIEVNFTGPLLMTESLLPLLRASQVSGLHKKSGDTTQQQQVVVAGGRIIYVGCTTHSLIGRKYTGKEVAEGYAREDSWIMKKYRANPDDDTSYIGNVMAATSKLGNIFHTLSLHDRRLSGINLKDRTSKLRPYTACCAILPVLDLPKYRLPFPGNLIKSDGDTRQDPHSFTSSWMGRLQNVMLPFRTNPESAVENVLECCLSPTLVSGGMYVEGKELSGRDDNAGVIQKFVSGALSLKAKDGKEQRQMVGYGAELTRQYAVKLTQPGGGNSGKN